MKEGNAGKGREERRRKRVIALGKYDI